jgi:ABC-type branched-subunit amino acid transport system ATPase component
VSVGNGSADALLATEHVTKSFGGLVAVEDVTFEVKPRSIVSIIGPNGAGKTTFFNMLTGLYKPTLGRISFGGTDVTGIRPDIITSLGVARTFQNIRLFNSMTAVENVMVGQHARMKTGLFGSILRPPSVRREEAEVRDKAREMLRYSGLQENHFGQLASNLSYGDQRRVEIARALASDPALLLLDEPTAGMNPQESAQLTAFMEQLREERALTILLIEHDMKVVMGVSEHITVLDHGTKIAGVPGQARGRSAELMPLLELHDIHTYYGNIEALKGISLTVEEGEVVTLIGSNGAGKSTTLRSISGLTPPREGSIQFEGREIGETPAQDIVSLGISQSPEGRHCFSRMTVRENLDLGAYLRRDDGVNTDLERIYELFPRLKERERQKAGTMSGGEQQMLAIGRALMANPKLLLLDEPSMGIAPVLVERIYETIVEINRQGTTILLVEQNANYALEVSVRAYVLETGTVALADKSDKLRDNPDVQKAYLGA